MPSVASFLPKITFVRDVWINKAWMVAKTAGSAKTAVNATMVTNR